MSARKATSIPLVLIALAFTCGCAITTGAEGPRAVGETFPKFAPSARCPNIFGEVTLEDVCDFIEARPTDRLSAPPGARVYRERWVGPFMGPMHSGSIVLTVFPDGRRVLRTPWRQGAYTLRADDLPDFESTLATSDFGELPVYNAHRDACFDGVATSLEAIVDGVYRAAFFSRCGGVSSESVATALDQLFVFAAGLSGLSYPVNPENPTFRG